MICYKCCGVALVFLIANIFMIFTCSKKLKNDFKNTLSNEEKNLYQNIINERKRIYYSGYLLGIFLSILVVAFFKKLLKLNKMSNVCIIATITFVTNYLFYILYPKKDYMILHLKNKEQIEEWLDIYKYMQFRYHLGFVLGIVALIFASIAIC